jgi:oxygen-independent coproporphyrinogen III oxidase
MMGETEEKWIDAIKRTIDLQPDSVTIYQMELPYNTVISQDILKKGVASPIADWTTKRRWLNYAFEQFLAHDYEIAGSDIVSTKKKTCRFIYRNALWQGGDMIGIGVSSFSHFGGVNFQNAHNFEEYVRILNEDRLPLLRAVSLTPKQRLIREMVLQLKTGRLDTGYFQKKFGVNVWEEFQPVYEELENKSLLQRDDGTILLTRRGLLEVDHFLLDFFEPELRTVRYA